MKILAVTSSYPRHSGDIAGFFVQEHVDLLRTAGHQVQVVTWADPTACSDDVVRVSYAPSNFQTLFYGDGAPENLAHRSRALLAPTAIALMYREIMRRGRAVDLIIGHWLIPAGWLVRRAGKALNKPTLVIGHSGGVHLLARLPQALAKRLATDICNGDMSLPTNALRDKLDAMIGRESHARILPMGFSPIRALPKSQRALFMGRLVPIKRIDLALDAAARSGFPIDIAGDGPLRGELERHAKEVGANATFHGVVTGDQKARLLGRAQVVLMPSTRIAGRHEGLPVSLLEACSAGAIPIIGDIPGADCVARQTWQFPNGVDEWAEALTRAMSASDALTEDTMALAERLSWPSLSAKWLSVIEEAAAPRHAPRS